MHVRAVGPYGAFTATLVELTTDDGLVGWGECIARRAPRVTDVVVRDLLWPVIEGRDPHDRGMSSPRAHVLPLLDNDAAK